MFYDRTATCVTRAVLMSDVLRCGKTSTLLLLMHISQYRVRDDSAGGFETLQISSVALSISFVMFFCSSVRME
jgi:hypothetical protein